MLPIATGSIAFPGNILIGPGTGQIGVGTWIPNPASPVISRPTVNGIPWAVVGDQVQFTYDDDRGVQILTIMPTGASLVVASNGVLAALVGTLVGTDVTIGIGPNTFVNG
jgi:hypothetical protein